MQDDEAKIATEKEDKILKKIITEAEGIEMHSINVWQGLVPPTPVPTIAVQQ